VNPHRCVTVCSLADDVVLERRRPIGDHEVTAPAGELVGFINVVSDGRGHTFLVDTKTRGLPAARDRHARHRARTAGHEWLHVAFDDHLRAFYVDACGFAPTNGGLIRLR
jgi:hypothetical protein